MRTRERLDSIHISLALSPDNDHVLSLSHFLNALRPHLIEVILLTARFKVHHTENKYYNFDDHWPLTNAAPKDMAPDASFVK